MNPASEPQHLKRVLGLFSCVMLVVGNMIGVGIFATPGRVAVLLETPGLVFLAWLLGGALAIAGALAYAELGAMFPRAGGNYVFLREAYGPFWGFLYGWSATLITQAGTAAVLAVGFTKYAGIENALAVQAIAVGMILTIGGLNYMGVKVGAAVVTTITVLKLIAIFGFAALAVLIGHGALANASPFWSSAHALRPTPDALGIPAAIAMALIPIMYTYSGWNATVYVGGEVKDPGRTIPLSLIVGVLLTGGIYLLLNAVYLYAMPIGDMRGVIAIAREASGRLFSPAAARGVSTFIAFSILGCLNAHLLSSPRIPFALAQDGYFLPAFAKVHPKYFTPANAIVLITIWSALLAIWGGIDHKHFYRLLDDYVTVPSLLINALTVAGIFVLRRTQPDAPRPYRAWGYPVLPALFILTVAWMVFNAVRQDWTAGLAGILMIAAGAPFYWLFARGRSAAP